MNDVVKVLKGKLEKHEGKLKAHLESERILEKEYEERKKNGSDKEERVGKKLLSTIKNIEYHTAKVKTYKSVIAMLEKNS